MAQFAVSKEAGKLSAKWMEQITTNSGVNFSTVVVDVVNPVELFLSSDFQD